MKISEYFDLIKKHNKDAYEEMKDIPICEDCRTQYVPGEETFVLCTRHLERYHKLRELGFCDRCSNLYKDPCDSHNCLVLKKSIGVPIWKGRSSNRIPEEW